MLNLVCIFNKLDLTKTLGLLNLRSKKFSDMHQLFKHEYDKSSYNFPSPKSLNFEKHEPLFDQYA